MRKIILLFILGMGLISPAMAQMFPAARPTPVAPGSAAPVTAAASIPPTPVGTPGLPLLYFAVGAGTALPGTGFGTEGNPWIDSNTDTLAAGYGTSFNPSEAFAAIIGFNLDKTWSVNISLENYAFTTVQSSASNELNVIPSVRYTLDSGDVAPYLTAGYGFNFNSTSAVAPVSILSYNASAQWGYNTEAISNMVASGGVGLLVSIAGSGHFFAQAEYQQVFTAQGGFGYFPLMIGFQYP